MRCFVYSNIVWICLLHYTHIIMYIQSLPMSVKELSEECNERCHIQT